MIRFCLAFLGLCLVAPSSRALVYVNRTLTGLPNCAYTLGDIDIGGTAYWDPGYQNAYGSCVGLQPGPPFILERNLRILPGGSLTLENIDLTGDVTFTVDAGGQLTMLDAGLVGYSRLNILGAVDATNSTFDRYQSGTAIFMQNQWDATFTSCSFDFRDAGTSAIQSVASSATNPPTVTFLDCTFSHSTPLATLLDIQTGTVLIESCTFDTVDGIAVQIRNAEEVQLRFNTFANVTGNPVQIRGSEIRELRGNQGTGNGLNAIVLAYSNGTVEAAASGISTFQSEPLFPLQVHSVLSVPSDATLILEPQTVLKFLLSSSNVLVQGALQANGAVFTSNHDNIGGNTGGSGDPQPGDWEGIIVQGATEITTPLADADFQGCTISYAGNGTNTGNAIRQLTRASLTVSNSTISYTGGDGILCTGSSGGLGSVGATIQNSYLHHNGWRAISFGSGDHIWVARNNEIAANGVGIRIQGTTTPPQQIEANRIVGNQSEGLTIESSGAPLIVNNVICANGLAGISKLALNDAGGSRILNNHIYGNGGDGIRLRRSLAGQPEPVIVNNLLAENAGYGINEVDSSTDSSPRHGDFFGNASGLMRRNAGASLTLVQINQLAGAGGNLEADPLLEVVAQGSIDAVTYDAATGRSTLTDASAAFADLSGLAINPDLTQKRRFLIHSSGGSSVQIEGDVTAIAAVGENYDVVEDIQDDPLSPLVNTGESHPDLPATDILGNARLLGAAVDIGAYEMDIVVAVVEPRGVSGAELGQNYPNPSGALTEIRFRLPARESVRLELFDMRGRRVAELLRGERDAGVHHAFFDTSTLPAGVYFYRLQTARQLISRRMIVLD